MIKDISEVGNKIHEPKRLFIKSNVIFSVLVSIYKPLPCQVWYPYDLWKMVGDIAIFICHEITYNHVLEELCNFVHGSPVPSTILLSSLVVMSHVKTEV